MRTKIALVLSLTIAICLLIIWFGIIKHFTTEQVNIPNQFVKPPSTEMIQKNTGCVSYESIASIQPWNVDPNCQTYHPKQK